MFNKAFTSREFKFELLKLGDPVVLIHRSFELYNLPILFYFPNQTIVREFFGGNS